MEKWNTKALGKNEHIKIQGRNDTKMVYTQTFHHIQPLSYWIYNIVNAMALYGLATQGVNSLRPSDAYMRR